MFPNLFSPMKIGNCEIPNRLVVPAMVANINTADGFATERYIKYHEEKAKGGWGLIITEDYGINPNAKGYPFIAGLWSEDQIPSHKKLTDTIHKYDSKIFCQIYHAGRQTNSNVNGGVQPVSPSAIACPWNKTIPKELSVEEIKELVKQFGITAANAKKAGFDGVELHAAHGYLVHQFLSHNSNKRTDEYGGNYENRTRFLKEVMFSIREAIGPDFPLCVRMSGEEYAEGGRIMFESRQIIRDIEAWGADALHLSFSMYGTRSSHGIIPSFFQNRGFNVKLAEEAKTLIKIPVITVGRIQEPTMAEDIIASGKADFVGMARASLTDPHFPEKAKNGEIQEIRQCVGCLQCASSTYLAVPIFCMVNPELGFEFETDYSKAPVSKKIFVAGGGIAGMQAARGAAMKGHEVHLYEASEKLGGQFVAAAYPPYKGDFASYPAWLIRQIKKLGVNIHMNTALTVEIVKEEKPDKVILATGARPMIPAVPGIEGPNVMLAEDVLLGRKYPGMNILVAGGGMIGSETAAYLATQCKEKVAVIEMMSEIACDMDGGIRDDLKDMLKRNFVEIMTETKLAGVTEKGALIEKGGTVTLYPCETVVLAIGTCANNPLESQLKGICETVVVGDAFKPRQAVKASREGFTSGMNA